MIWVQTRYLRCRKWVDTFFGCVMCLDALLVRTAIQHFWYYNALVTLQKSWRKHVFGDCYCKIPKSRNSARNGRIPFYYLSNS